MGKEKEIKIEVYSEHPYSYSNDSKSVITAEEKMKNMKKHHHHHRIINNSNENNDPAQKQNEWQIKTTTIIELIEICIDKMWTVLIWYII